MQTKIMVSVFFVASISQIMKCDVYRVGFDYDQFTKLTRTVKIKEASVEQ